MTMTPEAVAIAFHAALTSAEPESARTLMGSGFHWHAAHPVNDLDGPDAFFTDYWAPILAAIPDIEARPFVRVAGAYDGKALDGDGSAGDWVCSTGYFAGTFKAPLFGIPATHRPVFLRYSELLRIEDQKVAEGYIIPDFLDLMVQAGVCPLRPSLGHPGSVMPPMTMDGLHRPNADPAEAQASLDLVLAMLDGLGRFDGKSLFTMDQEQFWTEDFVWFGPGGIGTSRGLSGFRSLHQGPFLKSFPIRAVDRSKTLVADGNYVATGGWPHMTAEHLGGGWLGLPPSGQKLTMRVMDFWRRDGDRLAENWVSIDVLHILDQMGLDLLRQMRQALGEYGEDIADL
ncbi:MAG: ester cyclase [Parvularculaceae bacterium]|nr:ester cyclase [Parvularculaceae bacterium]